jgi:hypothetical protein
MNMLWNSPAALAAMTLALCLLAVPCICTGISFGATGTAVCIACALPLFIAGMLDKPYEVPDFGTARSFIPVFVGGVMLSAGFRFALRAFALYSAKR